MSHDRARGHFEERARSAEAHVSAVRDVLERIDLTVATEKTGT